MNDRLEDAGPLIAAWLPLARQVAAGLIGLAVLGPLPVAAAEPPVVVAVAQSEDSEAIMAAGSEAAANADGDANAGADANVEADTEIHGIPSVDPLDDLLRSLMPRSPRSTGTAVQEGPIEGRSRLLSSRSVTQVIEAAGIRPEQYGLDIRPIGTGRLRADHNPDRALNPASTMKLVTTYVSLAMLGPDYRWNTDLYIDGRLKDGVLHGDLVLKGGGDPKLVIEDLTELMARLRQAGVNEIRGDIVVDDSLYAATAERTEAFDGDNSRPYNVGPYAALMNFKATRFTISPRSRAVTMDPPLAGVRIDNQVRVIKGRCRPNGAHFSIDDDRGTATRPVIRITGSQVQGCGEQFFYAAVLSHSQFVAGLLKASWKEAGGKLTGDVRVKSGAARGEPFLRWESPRSLTDVVHDVNKFSNNVMARMLLLQVGAHNRTDPSLPVTVESARELVRDWYRSQGLDLPSLVIENGSGLSRTERISARDLTSLLTHAARSPLGQRFEESLPQVGIDGTMRTRLRRDPVAGQAFIKTGTLRDVRAIAGYVTAASGERYAVSLLINDQESNAGRAQDALLSWIHQNG